MQQKQDRGVFRDEQEVPGGFLWTEEGVGKYGLVSNSSAHLLSLAAGPPRPLQRFPKEDGEQRRFVSVELLHSYEGMGVAGIECAGGCACEPAKVDCTSEAFSLPRAYQVRSRNDRGNWRDSWRGLEALRTVHCISEQ